MAPKSKKVRNNRFPRQKLQFRRGSLIFAQNSRTSRLESRGFFAQNKGRKVYLFGLIAFIVSLFFIFNYFSKSKVAGSNSTEKGGGQVEATQEVKLKEVYEKQAGIPLGEDFSPRFSVFEDSQLGFKIAYPVGFVATSTDNGVNLAPEQGNGSISVTVNNGAVDVKTNSSGLDVKQAGILEAAGSFIRDSFQFIPENANKESPKDRFSGGQGEEKY